MTCARVPTQAKNNKMIHTVGRGHAMEEAREIEAALGVAPFGRLSEESLRRKHPCL